jgi:hypothetical protein
MRRFGTMLATMLMVVGLGIFVGTQPAAASTVHPGNVGHCDIYNFCLWDSPYDIFTDPRWERDATEMPRNTCLGNLEPVTSMINNDTQYQIYVSANANCAGTIAGGTIALIHGYSGPAGMSAAWNNRIRGFWRTSTIEHCYC